MSSRLTKKLLVALMVSAVSFAVIVTAQFRIDGQRLERPFDELLYMPNERLLNHFTAGMSSIVADWLWIRCTQYTARHFRGDHDFAWLNHLCNMITRLDPYFVAAYRYGGIFLAMLKADDDACINLLEKGMVRNPYAWELPNEIAMTYLINRPDDPDSPKQAAKYLAMAVETGRAPQSVIELASALQMKQDMRDVERTMWESLLRGPDAFLREIATQKLQTLGLRDTCAQLDMAASMYEQRLGVRPATLLDLVTGGIVTSLPADPLGGSFFLDANGKAQNTTVLDERVARALGTYRSALDKFHNKHGKWPATLRELADDRIMTEFIPHPYAGRDWQYDPVSGHIE